MNRKNLMLALGAAFAVGLITYMVLRKRNAKGLTIVVNDYNGKYKDHPKIKRFLADLPGMFDRSVRKIKQKTGLDEPDLTITFTLSDDFDADPFHSPSAGMKCKPIDYREGKGNCRDYPIEFGAANIVNDFKGRTLPEKTIAHELTHVFMFYHIPGMNDKPDYFVEGWPIHVAGQEDDIKNTLKNTRADSGNKFDYKDSETRVHTYGKLIDEFRKAYNI
jgi:hypothetical protein